MSDPIQIGLVADGISELTSEEIERVCTALQRQIDEHVGPAWNVQATVRRAPAPGVSAPGHMTIVVLRDIFTHGMAGYHKEHNSSGYSLVRYGGDWSITASHECVEMLCNEHCDKFYEGPSPMGQGVVSFLGEVCDPCQNHAAAYDIDIDGVAVKVSDFCLPAYYQVAGAAGGFSHSGRISTPFEVLDGGYLCWKVGNRLFKHSRIPGDPEFSETDLAPYADLREQIYAATPQAFDLRAYADQKVASARHALRRRVDAAVLEVEAAWIRSFERMRARAARASGSRE